MNIYRLEKFKQTLTLAERAFAQYPKVYSLELAINDLKYLIAIEEGIEHDYNHLLNWQVLGWPLIRELDGFEYENLIDLLCALEGEVIWMKVERRPK